MDDSWSPAEQHAGEYWSVEQCAWVRCPVPVAVPEQREPVPETVDA